MFSVTSGKDVFHDLAAREAATKARQLRRDGRNDVEILRSDGSRISLYALDQLLREQGGW